MKGYRQEEDFIVKYIAKNQDTRRRGLIGKSLVKVKEEEFYEKGIDGDIMIPRNFEWELSTGLII